MCLLLHFLDEGTFQIVTQYSRNCFASLQENMFENQEPSVKYGNDLICLGTLSLEFLNHIFKPLQH